MSYESKKTVQLFTAGLIGITIMTLFTFGLRAVGFSAPDFPAQYGAILNGQVYPASGSALWWLGLAWHFVNGTVIFSFLYEYLVDRGALAETSRISQGVIYAAVLWLLTSLTVAPAAGEGTFFRYLTHPGVTAMTALAGWLIYGVVLDRMTREPSVATLEIYSEHDDRMAA